MAKVRFSFITLKRIYLRCNVTDCCDISFPFGWLFLPVDLIGRPFSQSTRDHFLPLLTSTHWWSQTQLALRRVFQLDPDFQERMFARQMAVMKGQAWNVVETLKTEDHGPLELTRRAKVCVWDDLVDVPVAVPMRATSAEMRRRHTDEMLRHGHGRRRSNLDEMDIGAVNSSPSKQRTASKTDADSDTDALLGDLATPPGKMPRSGRFDSTSAAAPPSLTRGETDPQLPPPAAANGSPKKQREQKSEAAAEGSSRSTVRPGVSMHSKSDGATISSSLRGAALNMYAPDRERRFSFASVSSQPRNGGKSIAQALYGSGRRRGGSSAELGSDEDDYDDDDDYDDIEGDLGYAAAEGMEGNRRKVIVERLEAVKSKNPVFSCC